jgi:hypothetical protein
VAVLSREAPEMQCQIAYEDQYGGGVSWHEVLRIWLPNAEFIKNTICTTLITISIESMCQRFKRKHSSHRPKGIIVHDREIGKKLASFTIYDAESEPEPQELQKIPRKVPRGSTRGTYSNPLSSLRKNLIAALVSRRAVPRMSSTFPCWSTARYR